MDVFYLIVLSIAIVFLILMLTVAGILMKNQNKDLAYPPVSNTCPDNWSFDKNGCNIHGNSGTFNPNAPAESFVDDTPGHVNGDNFIDFNDSRWTGRKGKSAICAKREWANSYGITWDGVANSNACKN
jgi:hypothetical protein